MASFMWPSTALYVFDIARRVFRTYSNIYDRAFLRKYLTVKSRELSSQKCPSVMFHWVLNTPLVAERRGVFTQPVFTCSKLTIETLEQGVKYVQS